MFNIMKKIISSILYSWGKKDYNLFVFNSYKNMRYDFNSKYFFEYMIKETDYECKFIIDNDKLRDELNNKIGDYFITTKKINDLKTIWKAGIWVTSTGLPIRFPFFNNDRVIINLWHGIPLKKVGILRNNISFVKKLIIKYIYANNYTFISTTSSKLIDVMAKSFSVEKNKIKVLGEPRNEVIFSRNSKSVINKYINNLPEYDELILYAPTFREQYSTELFPFDDFNENELEKFLIENKLILFIRTHPLEKKIKKFESIDRVYYLNNDKVSDIMEIINIFDLLITDYSSIYIDYLLLEKPVMFLDYDRDKYLKFRGFNFDYDKVTPGPKPNSFKNFLYESEKLLNDYNYYSEKRKNCKYFFHEIVNNSNELILDEIMNKIKDLK